MFLDLNERTIINKNSFIVVFRRKFKPFSLQINNYAFNNYNFFIKHTSMPIESLQAIASTNMFNSTGIVAPPIYLAKEYQTEETFELSQDVTKMSEFKDVTIMIDTPFFIDPRQMQTDAKAAANEIFYHSLKQYLLNYMTEDCYNQYTSLFLIDTLRTETDRNPNNLFFYKTDNSDKYSGIIAIDHTLTRLPSKIYHISDSIFDFEKFLYHEFLSTQNAILQSKDSFKNRHDSLCDLLHSGKLSNSNIETLKKALQFDLPGEIKKVGKHYNIPSSIVEKKYYSNERLWEYNQTHIGKELGL